MAQSQQPERDGEAEFVRAIVTDPRNVPDVMRLYGYLGASSEEHHERLYLNPDLSQYVEVPRAAILHRMTASAEQDPNRGVTLWVRRDAALIYKSAPAAQALAQYFAGAIAGAAAAGAAAAPQLPITHNVYCLPTRVGPGCPYPTEICTIVGPACQSRHQFCPPPAVEPWGAAGAAAMPAAPPFFTGPNCPPNTALCGITQLCPPRTPFCLNTRFLACPPHTPLCLTVVPDWCINLSPVVSGCQPCPETPGVPAPEALRAVAGAAQPALLSAYPAACPPRTFIECTQICHTHQPPCHTYVIVSCGVACFPTPQYECPPSLAAALCGGSQQIPCQAAAVGFYGVPQGGLGGGQPEMAAQAAALGFRPPPQFSPACSFRVCSGYFGCL